MELLHVKSSHYGDRRIGKIEDHGGFHVKLFTYMLFTHATGINFSINILTGLFVAKQNVLTINNT